VSPIRILIIAFALTLAGAAPAHAKECAPVPFTPQSDDIAAEIRVAGVTCTFARRFVRDSAGRPPRSFRGFICARHRVEDATLAHTRYRCTRGAKLVRWNRY
jgi:hypothetical protein